MTPKDIRKAFMNEFKKNPKSTNLNKLLDWIDENYKKCPCCEERKPLNEFRARYKQCKECSKLKRKTNSKEKKEIPKTETKKKQPKKEKTKTNKISKKELEKKKIEEMKYELQDEYDDVYNEFFEFDDMRSIFKDQVIDLLKTTFKLSDDYYTLSHIKEDLYEKISFDRNEFDLRKMKNLIKEFNKIKNKKVLTISYEEYKKQEAKENEKRREDFLNSIYDEDDDLKNDVIIKDSDSE